MIFAIAAAPALSQTAAISEPEPNTVALEDWREATRKWGQIVMIKAGYLYGSGLLHDGIEGRVLVRFLIEENGIPQQCMTFESSGNKELDALACKAVRLAPTAPVRIDEEGSKEAAWVILPIRFVISDKLESGN